MYDKIELNNNKFMRGIYLVGGLVSLGFGILGIFIPLLPTTVFILIAAWFFSKSSRRLHKWLFYNQHFGKLLRNYKEKKGIPQKIKIRTIAFLWISLGISIYLIFELLWLIILTLVGIGVTWHLLSINTYIEPGDESYENI